MLGIAAAAAGALAGAVSAALPSAARLLGSTWPATGAGAGAGAVLAAAGYLAHRRLLMGAVADAVEQARLDLVLELDEISERVLAAEAATAEHVAAQHPAAQHPAAQHPAAQHPAAQHPATQHPAAQHPAAQHAAAGLDDADSVPAGSVEAELVLAGQDPAELVPAELVLAEPADAGPGAAGSVHTGPLPAAPVPAGPVTRGRARPDVLLAERGARPAVADLVASLPRPRPVSRVELERVVARLVAVARAGAGGGVEGRPDVLVLLGRDGRVSGLSAASARALGWTEADLVGHSFAGLVHVADLPTFSGLLDGVVGGGAGAGRRHLVRVRGGDGAWRTVEWTGWPAEDPAYVALAGADVTDRLRLEADFLHQATHDPLTGLPNRSALLHLAAEAVAAAGRENPLSVLVIDLDRFKDVNDSLGHVVGDHLLAQVGPRLRGALRPTDTIARLGGDEFAVLLPTAGQDGARMVADRLAEALDSPFEVDGIQLHVEASIGIAVSHRDDRVETTMVEGLLREADIAMYRAKDEGSVIVQFDPERDAGQGRSRLELSAQLRKAIAEGELVLYYQPTVDVFEGRLAGVEALVRWNHPERGLLPPGVFLPLAESTGLIVPLSRLVLATAVEQAAEWNRAGMPVQIAVNLSPRWLQHSDIPRIVSDLLERHDVPPDLLRLEITESVVLAQPEHALGQLEQLRDMGVGLSLDDFGTGYSSMTHLRNLPVDELKVDRGFVHAMTSSPQDAVIVRAAIELGHNLGMDVVAEGIEDADTLAEVVAAGCCLAQGYYFSMALPPKDLVAWAVERFPDFGTPGGPPATRTPRDG